MTAYLGAPAHLRSDPRDLVGAQERCDAIQAEFRVERERPSLRRAEEKAAPLRRPDPPPIAAGLVPTDNGLNLRLAEEVEYARRMLESMGDDLSADPAILMRHATSLQYIDIVGQILGHIAAVVRSSDPPAAVERIGMCDLRARLIRQSIR